MKLFLAPHCDDETLFGAFTIMREKPHVLVVYDSVVQGLRSLPITAEMRRSETRAALSILFDGNPDLKWGHVSDVTAPSTDTMDKFEALAEKFGDDIDHVWAPAVEEGGHDQHNLVGQIADELWPGKVTHYLTYTRHAGKSRSENEVPIEDPEWIIRKHRALAGYTSQITVREAGCWPHFMEDLREYYADPK